MPYIHQLHDWPNFIWNPEAVLAPLGMVRHLQGKLNSSKWAKIAKCSTDTALRDIQDLMDKGILRKEAAGGRSTSYELVGQEPE